MKRLAVDLVILNERGASYVQDLQIALETLVRTSRSRTHLGAEGDARRHLRAAQRPDLRRDPRAAARRGAGGAARPARQPGGPTRSPSGAAWRAAARRRKPAPDAGAATAGTGRGPARPCEFFNGLGGFSPDGREYVTVLGPGQSTPAPWINVVANPSFGFQVAVEGGGYTWSQQQPRQPAHAVVERSGQRPARRGPLCARRRQRRPVDADGAADPPRAGALHRPAWARLQPLRAGGAGHRARAAAVRAARRSDQDLAPHHAQHLRPPRAVCRSRPTSNGCSACRAARRRRRSSPSIDAATGAIFARNPWNIASRRACGLRRPGRPPDRMDRRPRRVHRPQRHHRQSRRAESRAVPLSQRVGAGLDPCARAADDGRARARRQRPRSSSSSARPATPPRRGP